VVQDPEHTGVPSGEAIGHRGSQFSPVRLFDCITAVRWLIGSSQERIDDYAVASRNREHQGDSAGGGLVVAAMVAMRYVGEPLPAAGVCLSPWIDTEATGHSFITNAASDPNGMKLSSDTPLINELRGSHGARVAVSRIGSALNGAGWAVVRSQW
jgi:acetyl esterase/lipase